MRLVVASRFPPLNSVYFTHQVRPGIWISKHYAPSPMPDFVVENTRLTWLYSPQKEIYRGRGSWCLTLGARFLNFPCNQDLGILRLYEQVRKNMPQFCGDMAMNQQPDLSHIVC